MFNYIKKLVDNQNIKKLKKSWQIKLFHYNNPRQCVYSSLKELSNSEQIHSKSKKNGKKIRVLMKNLPVSLWTYWLGVVSPNIRLEVWILGQGSDW